jgi:predicted ATPase/DNA-binding winged helix-turn-helix (wHTH) protein
VALGEQTEQIAYSLGCIRIYPRQRLVVLGDEVMPVGPALFALLYYFAQNPDCLLSRDQIIKGAWGNTYLSDSAISTYMAQARGLIGHEGVRSVFAKGYVVTVPAGPLSGQNAEPPLRSEPVQPTIKLPRRPQQLIGRDTELADLEDHLRDHRLISLVGPSGAGKTMLATELCWRMIRKFPKFHDGMVMVDLASVTDRVAAASTLAHALDLPLHQATDTPLDAIADAIRDRQMLITLDNCEHLVRWVVEILQVLQERAPGLTVLVTSQHVLEGLKQKVYWLKGLAVPPAGETDAAKIATYGAVKLFLDCAGMGDHDFVYSEAMAASVVDICTRLDGNPLSLEMAAARVHFYQMDGLRGQLDQRFGLLRRGSGTAILRHASLLEMTESSYNLLDPAERQFFWRLGIFPGWFSAGEAVAVAGADSSDSQAAHDLLHALVNKSLVTREDGAETRYRLLETLRIYAIGQLGASGEQRMIAARHARYFKELFARDEEAWEALPDWQLRRIYAPQIDNLRAALNTTLTDPELLATGIILAGVSGRLWSILVLIPEGQGYFDRFLEFAGEDTPPADTARLLRYAGILCRHADRQRTVTLLKQSAATYRKLKDWLNLGSVLAMLGGEYIYLGRYDDSKATLDEASKYLSGSNRIKSKWEAMNNSGNLAWNINDIPEAVRCLGLACALAREMEDPLRENIVLHNLGELEMRRGAIDTAIDYARHAVGGLQAVGETSHRAQALTNLGTYLTLRGDLADAGRQALDGLELVIHEGGHRWRARLQLCAVLAVYAGEYAWGASLLGHASGEQTRGGEVREPTEQQLVDQALAFLATRCKPAEIEVWLADGAKWSVDRAVALILRRIVPLLAPTVSDDTVETHGSESTVRVERTNSGE